MRDPIDKLFAWSMEAMETCAHSYQSKFLVRTLSWRAAQKGRVCRLLTQPRGRAERLRLLAEYVVLAYRCLVHVASQNGGGPGRG